MTSEQGECLPLPHTKGTKPAPSSVKILVYLMQVKKNIIAYFHQKNIQKSTEGGTRTPTGLHPPDFESGASTNFATPANCSCILYAKLFYYTIMSQVDGIGWGNISI